MYNPNVNGIESSNGNGLSMWEFASHFGINPMHFAGAQAPSTNPMIMPDLGCSSLWHKYAWQNGDTVSLTELGGEISHAEQNIERLIGRHVAPKYRSEYIPNERNGRIGYRADHLIVHLDYCEQLAFGGEQYTLVATAPAVYTDNDGDGFPEVCTVTFPIGSITTDDYENLRLFYDGFGSDETYMVYPVKSLVIDDVGGVITVTLDTWRCVRPELREEFPVAGEEPFGAIDISIASNRVSSFALYLYSVSGYDEAHPEAQITYVLGCGASTTVQTIPALVEIENKAVGTVRVYPAKAEYDSGGNFTGFARAAAAGYVQNVQISYLSGLRNERFERGESTSWLKPGLLKPIAVLAMARLKRPFRTCSNLAEYIENLQNDLTLRTQSGARFIDLVDVLACPFGTRAGEVEAWRVVKYVLKYKNMSARAI